MNAERGEIRTLLKKLMNYFRFKSCGFKVFKYSCTCSLCFNEIHDHFHVCVKMFEHEYLYANT